MYEEGHSGFALKNIILKILLLIVVIFLIIWLFPTKNYVKNLINSKLGTGDNQTFTTNIYAMKDAAIGYFNGDRLPDKTGDSKKLTLKEMVDKNLVVDITDSNNRKCDYQKSYVEVTKNESDYTMKVNLACKDKTDSITSYMVYASDVYSKKKLTENKVSEDKKETTKKINDSKETTKEKAEKECEYTKSTGGYWSNYGAWSAWSTTKVVSSNSRQVETKVDKVAVGTIVEQEGTTKHTQSPKKVLVTKNNTKYYIYVCPADFDNGGTYDNYVTCVKTIPNYVNKTSYKNATYYRYRDRHYINNSSDTKWSKCNDESLINNGYKTTGNTR